MARDSISTHTLRAAYCLAPVRKVSSTFLAKGVRETPQELPRHNRHLPFLRHLHIKHYMIPIK